MIGKSNASINTYATLKITTFTPLSIRVLKDGRDNPGITLITNYTLPDDTYRKVYVYRIKRSCFGELVVNGSCSPTAAGGVLTATEAITISNAQEYELTLTYRHFIFPSNMYTIHVEATGDSSYSQSTNNIRFVIYGYGRFCVANSNGYSMAECKAVVITGSFIPPFGGNASFTAYITAQAPDLSMSGRETWIFQKQTFKTTSSEDPITEIRMDLNTIARNYGYYMGIIGQFQGTLNAMYFEY